MLPDSAISEIADSFIMLDGRVSIESFVELRGFYKYDADRIKRKIKEEMNEHFIV